MTPVPPASILGSIAVLPAMTPVSIPFDAGLVPAGIFVITGIFMLLTGRKLLRIGLGVIGAVIGALLGEAAGLSFANALSPLTWSTIGGCLGLGFGLLLWRFTVATLMAASCAGISVLIVGMAIRSGIIEPVDPGTEPPPTPVREQPETPTEGSRETSPSIEDALIEAARTRAESELADGLARAGQMTESWLTALNRRIARATTGLDTHWKDLDPMVRRALAGVALLGGVFGFLFGLVAWKRSGAIVTAVAGAGLVLIGGLIGFESLVPGAQGRLESLHPGIWIGLWLVLALGGGLIQWHSERKDADTRGSDRSKG